MTASSSVVSLANRALFQAGARASISSLTEDSTEANAVNLLWLPTFEQLARVAPWNCLREQGTLTLVAAAIGTPENPNSDPPFPPTPWLYSYQTPANNLDIRYLLPSQVNNTPTGMVPISTVANMAPIWVPGAYDIPFAVANGRDAGGNAINVILTNLSQAQAVYTVNEPNPIIFDSLFEQAFVSSLAVFLTAGLTLNLPLMKLSIGIADSAIAQARVRDGDEGSTSQDRVPDWMRARTTGYLYDYGGAGANPWSSYPSMCWPSV